MLKMIFTTSMLLLVARCCSILTGIYIANQLTKPEYGEYAVVLSLIVISSLFPGGGIQNFIAKNLSKGLITLRDWSAILFLIITIYLVTVSFLNYFYHENSFIDKVAGIILLKTLLYVFAGIANGLGLIFQSKLIDRAYVPIFQFLLVVVFLRHGTLSEFISTFLYVHMVAVVFGILHAANSYFSKSQAAKGFVDVRFSELGDFWVIFVFGNFTIDFLLLFINEYVPLSDVADLKVALQASMLSTLPLVVVNNYLIPKLAKNFEKGFFKESETIIKKLNRLTFAFALVMLLITLVYGKIVLTIVFSDKYMGAYDLLVGLQFVHLINVMFGPSMTILTMSANTGVATLITVVSVVVLVLLANILMPVFLVESFILVYFIYVLFLNVCLTYFINKRLGIKNWLR